MLDPLADNGGPTFTHALLPGSPAIDAGDNADAPEFDQRGPGFPRVVNGVIDIGAFEVQPAALTMQLDIKPGGGPNRVNLRSNGVLPVAVLTTPEFDAAAIDRSAIRFGDVDLAGRVSPLRSALEDVDGDGDLDLILHFSMRQIREAGALTADSTQVELTGVTAAGAPWRGTDSVDMVRHGRERHDDPGPEDLVAALLGDDERWPTP